MTARATALTRTMQQPKMQQEYYSLFEPYFSFDGKSDGDEYDPCNVFVEEYDPVDNWFVDLSQYTTRVITPTRVGIDLEAVLLQVSLFKKEENRLAPKLSEYFRKSDKDLFNMSAIYVLRQNRLKITRDSVHVAHQMLRKEQLKAFHVSEYEFKFTEPKSAFIRAIKSYDKDIYNLSPEWALKLAGVKTRRIGDIIAVMRCIDYVIEARK